MRLFCFSQRAQPEELEKIKKHYETSDEEQVKLLDKPEQWDIPETHQITLFFMHLATSDTSIVTYKGTFYMLFAMYTSLRFFHLRTNNEKVMFSTLRTLGWQMFIAFPWQVPVWTLPDPWVLQSSSLFHFSVEVHWRCCLHTAQDRDYSPRLQGTKALSKGSDLRYYQTFDKVSTLAFLRAKNSPSGSCGLFEWSACFVSNISNISMWWMHK